VHPIYAFEGAGGILVLREGVAHVPFAAHVCGKARIQSHACMTPKPNAFSLALFLENRYWHVTSRRVGFCSLCDLPGLWGAHYHSFTR
jgi:hypothetical protein